MSLSNTFGTLKLSSVYASIVFIVLFSIGFLGLKGIDAAAYVNQLTLANQLAGSQVSAIERRLERLLSSTYILAQEVRRSDGHVVEFDQFAADIIQSMDGISDLRLAPNGVTERIYPLAGNEMLIGSNLLEGQKRIREASTTGRELTLIGPFEQSPGKFMLVGRNPVFLEKGGEEYFWGFVSASIDLDRLFSVVDLNGLSKEKYSFQISSNNAESNEELIFYGSKPANENYRLFINPIAVYGGQWRLTMGVEDLHSFNFNLGLVVCFVVAFFFSFLLNRVLLEPERLRSRVQHQTRILEQLAFHDELTGLANRRYLIEKLEQEILELEGQEKQLALMYVDLDDFKRINDTLGHDIGDIVLRTVATRIREVVRDTDIVSRVGGDEFAVVLLDLGSAEQARKIADKIIKNVGRPIVVKEQVAKVGSTIGITFAPEDAIEIDKLFSNADLAMYTSKRAGKNQFSFFNAKMQKIVTDNLRLKENLRRAVDENEFYLVYQPILALENEKLHKFEALIRWRFPVNGKSSPVDFIDMAEETGLIMPIGYWVLEEVCRYIKARQEKRLETVPIAINISSAQLRDEHFGHTVEKIVNASGVDPRLIELEITESNIMEDIELALRLINQMRRFGMKISIDDFGTGYSSLAQLKKFPVDTLKIDRSFVTDLEDDADDREILEAIVAMVHKLGICVVAEGVETEKQLTFLKFIGCDSGQGFLFSRPLSAAKSDEFNLFWSHAPTDPKVINVFQGANSKKNAS